MRLITRKYDRTIGFGSHGLLCCGHSFAGQFMWGSENVFANSRNVQRKQDYTIHYCPHCGYGMAISGSENVLTNRRPTVRDNDTVTEFCGTGRVVVLDGNVFVN